MGTATPASDTHVPAADRVGVAVDRPVLLRGVVGSTAYGLARAGSDVDRLGIYAAPTRAILSMGHVTETIHCAGPDQDNDVTYHEVGKYMRLAAVANPTVLELLYLPEELIDITTPEGRMLREHRDAFLSASYVRSAYGGYALSQAKRLTARGDSFSSGTRNRTAKHARHCFRLLTQGGQLLTTGTMTVRLENPEEYWAFDDMPPGDILDKFARALEVFDALESDLPPAVDHDLLNDILLTIRDLHYSPTRRATLSESQQGTSRSADRTPEGAHRP